MVQRVLCPGVTAEQDKHARESLAVPKSLPAAQGLAIPAEGNSGVGRQPGHGIWLSSSGTPCSRSVSTKEHHAVVAEHMGFSSAAAAHHAAEASPLRSIMLW